MCVCVLDDAAVTWNLVWSQQEPQVSRLGLCLIKRQAYDVGTLALEGGMLTWYGEAGLCWVTALSVLYQTWQLQSALGLAYHSSHCSIIIHHWGLAKRLLATIHYSAYFLIFYLINSLQVYIVWATLNSNCCKISYCAFRWPHCCIQAWIIGTTLIHLLCVNWHSRISWQKKAKLR